ncbi:hypothetical protein F3Y22_tig00111513pilonHSYRG00042 [Hibiscus syriacus]|uniref:Leucine-rich repeat-containing N-terminal plant-type domain-containing protein n=1 Tax=Hibiscus syriacus TaxID=106335 RepID=A0A6A2XM27_HIBSY|nr:hypothetical protein F3Y22_tig00111513pilonHSYRG00042 [Hibiscus syriacus]
MQSGDLVGRHTVGATKHAPTVPCRCCCCSLMLREFQVIHRVNRTAGRETVAHRGKFEDDPDISCFEEERTLSFDKQRPADVMESDELKKHNPASKNIEAPILNIGLNAGLNKNGDSIVYVAAASPRALADLKIKTNTLVGLLSALGLAAATDTIESPFSSKSALRPIFRTGVSMFLLAGLCFFNSSDSITSAGVCLSLSLCCSIHSVDNLEFSQHEGAAAATARDSGSRLGRPDCIATYKVAPIAWRPTCFAPTAWRPIRALEFSHPKLWNMFPIKNRGRRSLSPSLNDDVLGLIVFRGDVQDPSQKLSSWNEDDDTPCNWIGEKCNSRLNRVTELNLNGSLFRQCGSVRSILLASNRLSGKIPSSLGSCVTLAAVNLSWNQFSGSLPGGILGLSGLRSSDLPANLLEDFSVNSLTGSLPPSMGSNVNLLALDFSKNSMSGDLPGWIFKTGSSQVSLSENKLGAKLSSPILASQRTSLQKIQVLDLSHNSFSGEIMNGIGALTSLKFLNLSRNSIVAPVFSPD